MWGGDIAFIYGTGECTGSQGTMVRGAAMARCRTEWRLEDRRIVVSVIQLCGAKGSAGMPGQGVL